MGRGSRRLRGTSGGAQPRAQRCPLLGEVRVGTGCSCAAPAGSGPARRPAQLRTCADTDLCGAAHDITVHPAAARRGAGAGGRGHGSWQCGGARRRVGAARGGAAPRRGRRQWESVSAPARLKLLFKAGAGKSTREMRRGRFWERPRVPLPVGSAAPGTAAEPAGGAGVAGGWEPTRGVRAVMRQDSSQIPARCRPRPSVCCCTSGRATLPLRVTVASWGAMAMAGGPRCCLRGEGLGQEGGEAEPRG